MTDRPTHPATARLSDESIYAGDPFPTYATLRAEAPLAWDPDGGWWAVSTHDEVLAVSRDPATFCSRRGILTFEIGVEYGSPPTMMHTDPPQHTRYRKLVQPGFSPALMRTIEASVRARVADLVEGIEPGEAVDVVPAFAPFPVLVIADLLGVPSADCEQFLLWSDAAIPDATDLTPDERMAQLADMNAYLLEAAQMARSARTAGRTGSDLVSVLAGVELDGQVLRDDELVMFLNQLLVAGNETSRSMISGGLWALATQPEQWARLVDDPAGPSAPRWRSGCAGRHRSWPSCAQPPGTPNRGTVITEGDPLLLLYVSANRDEAVFGPTADRFDVGRAANPHVAFGYGPHFCIGAALARMEGRVLLEELLALHVDRGARAAGTQPVCDHRRLRRAEVVFGSD